MQKVVAGQLRHVNGCKKNAHNFDAQLVTASGPPPTSRVIIDWPFPVLDQGNVGDCTANMWCNLVAYTSYLNGKEFISSRYFSYAIVREMVGVPLNVDTGAQIRDVFSIGTTMGACSEATWPSTPDSQWQVSPSIAARQEALKHEALLYFRVIGLDSMRRCIADGFPFGCGFGVYSTMESDVAANTGLVALPPAGENSVGGHAVTALGFDDNMVIGASVGAFKFLNSWGDGWGQRGFFWLPYDYFFQSLAWDATTLRRVKCD